MHRYKCLSCDTRIKSNKLCIDINACLVIQYVKTILIQYVNMINVKNQQIKNRKLHFKKY